MVMIIEMMRLGSMMFIPPKVQNIYKTPGNIAKDDRQPSNQPDKTYTPKGKYRRLAKLTNSEKKYFWIGIQTAEVSRKVTIYKPETVTISRMYVNHLGNICEFTPPNMVNSQCTYRAKFLRYAKDSLSAQEISGREKMLVLIFR